MGRLMPAMTSTWPGMVSELQQLEGVPPLMSVMTSTPLPSSRRAMASRARSCTWPMSWSAVTSTASKRSVSPRNTWATAAMKAWPSGAWVSSKMPTISGLRLAGVGFQRVDEHGRDVEAGLVENLLEAGGAGDVHFGEVVADDVQAHQQQAARGQHRPQRFGYFAVAL